MNTLILVAGPTAIGKTAFAIELAQALGTEILSCDSRQFYRELDIGVARPSPDELAAAPHHFIACRSVEQPYNVFDFEQEALALLATLFQRHPVVVAVGGSGLYLEALTQGIALLPDPAPGLRQELQGWSLERKQERLRQLDPAYWAVVDQRNPVRLQRALEVTLTAGRPYSEVLRQAQRPRPFRTLKVALTADRDTIKQRINLRTDLMVEQGLVEETRRLLPFRHLQALNTVGYKEIFAHLDGRCPLEAAVADIKTHTWQYAKKQRTWLRRYDDLVWVDREKKCSSLQFLENHLY